MFKKQKEWKQWLKLKIHKTKRNLMGKGKIETLRNSAMNESQAITTQILNYPLWKQRINNLHEIRELTCSVKCVRNNESGIYAKINYKSHTHSYAHTCIRANTHTHAHLHANTHTHTHANIRTHTRQHTHAHIHKHTISCQQILTQQLIFPNACWWN